ncbi:MAG: hypothetical protein PWR07_163 [Bacillota bacterium]|nr:hypothetical protein [Bacillota bacterium]
MSIDGWLLLVAVGFLLGYIVGHRHGRAEGFRDGAVFAPIEMRRESLERGRCTICGTGTGTGTRKAPDPDGEARNEAASPSRRSSPERE